eukprot:6488848-Amphidinium_carterae.1
MRQVLALPDKAVPPYTLPISLYGATNGMKMQVTIQGSLYPNVRDITKSWQMQQHPQRTSRNYTIVVVWNF